MEEEIIVLEDEIEVIEEIDMEEAAYVISSGATRHNDLGGRDEAYQHPIKSIIGLQEKLDSIESLKTQKRG